jgi:hypothetical protein
LACELSAENLAELSAEELIRRFVETAKATPFERNCAARNVSHT